MRPKSYSPTMAKLLQMEVEYLQRRRETNLRHTHKVRARWKALGLNSRGKPYKKKDQ